MFGSQAERNNFLHFNPTVETDPAVLHAKAEEKCAALETMLTDLFAYRVENRVIKPEHRDLWPKEEKVPVFIDFTATWP